MSPRASAAIGDYLDRGGAALLLLERHIFNPQSPTLVPVTTGLEGLLAERGVVASGDVVFDLASTERVSMRQGIFNVLREYPLWPVTFRGEDHATNRDLANASFGWAAPFKWDENDPAVTPLWTTTRSGGTRPPGMMVDPSFPIGATQDEVGEQTVAVAIAPVAGEGEDADGVEAGEADVDPDAGTAVDAAPRAGRIIAVGDADFLADFLLLPIDETVEFESAVEEDSWGRIKASVSR